MAEERFKTTGLGWLNATQFLGAMTIALLPNFAVRFCIVVITQFFYRVKSAGLENLPIEGGALLVSNHVTWVDALLISSITSRRIRFLMDRSIYETGWLRPLFRLMGVIPISAGDPPRRVVESFQKAREALGNGYMVCIFAEGRLTRNGNMSAFRAGFERIVRGTNYPVIPVHIGNAWGSIFSYYHGRLLIGAIARGDTLDRSLKNEKMIGILLPASVGGALTNLAMTLLGKVTVNLNFTASAGSMASAIQQCGIHTVISSRAFIEKLGPGFTRPPGIRYLEDITGSITPVRKATASVKALFLPAQVLAHSGSCGQDGIATVIFSSGSTGEPKGVKLSHANVLADIEQVRSVFRYTPQERFSAVLPFFHSFGLTVTLWAPVTCGFSVYYHPNPLEGVIIGKMVRENRLSIMVATPTFLLSWMRRAGEGDFASLRALGTGERCVVVVAVEDERKGEQLVVCCTPAAGNLIGLHNLLSNSSLPNLWRPKKDNYLAINEISTLGAGKIDIPRLKKLAAEFINTRPGHLQRVVNILRDAF